MLVHSSKSLGAFLQEDVFSREPSLPQVPSKVHYSAPTVPAYASRVPQMDVSSLDSVERSRVQVDQKQAEDLDRQLYQVRCCQPDAGYMPQPPATD